MKNFIRYNIENIKGSRRPPSLIDRDAPKQSRNLSYDPISYKKQFQQPSINNRLKKLQNQIHKIQENQNQSLILEQLSDIKQDIRYINNKKDHGRGLQTKQKTTSSYDEQQTIYTIGAHQSGNRVRSQSQNQDSYKQIAPTRLYSRKTLKLQEMLNQRAKRASSSYNKNAISLKVLYPIIKQYKLQGPQHGTIFYGYSKRNSQPVAIKYSQQSLTNIIEIYDRFWKNIAKARWPCVNRIYDYKSDDLNIIIMEKNKKSILGLPYLNVLLDILEALEFIHECGYLYRNIQPEHFMLNQQGQLVIIDFKRAKRYVDIKGHNLQVQQTVFTGSPFASNNQVRGHPESRKDDLESLGYFALLLYDMEIPWAGMNRQQTIKMRSSLTLQDLFNNNPKWIEYMAVVMKTPRNERPDYKRLAQILTS